ncbi:MAG: UDP-3-O-[Alphaproteobacteria bacterium]|nr:UDP-3-O-[3-hydroxymyristoyl] N-acetylglucosamine deacetylase [Alphaproteobacteria bacterium]
MLYQKTLGSAFSIEGIGVHSGKICSVKVSPAEENTGIMFQNSHELFPAIYNNVISTSLCTQISLGNTASVNTIEHLMAALYGMQISNAIIEPEGTEIPILDGSSLRFVELINQAGIVQQKSARKTIKILKKLKITDGDKFEEVIPDESFSISCSCDFQKKGLVTSPVHFDLNKNNFEKEIAPARTFGFFSEVEFIRKNNLAMGASMDNTVVYDDKGQPMNPEGLRMENESAKHKVLDLIGDLSLSGCWIQGKLNCFCPSHKLNNLIVRMIFNSSENYQIIQ